MPCRKEAIGKIKGGSELKVKGTEMISDPMKILDQLRDYGGSRDTEGLSRETLLAFWEADPQLREAVESAEINHENLRSEWGEALRLDESELCQMLQADYVNFYPEDAINPYVAVAASGPWIVTSHGAVLHDSGGYGMLGLGHAPKRLREIMSRSWVMANVMSPHFNQKRFADLLKAEIGSTRSECPFHSFICMNSGSEAVSVASRICDINAARLTEPGKPHHGKTIKQLALKEGFHGRTYRAAQVSHSTLPIYQENLASFREYELLEIVDPNDLDGLADVFESADRDGIFFEAFFIEPVLGEGIPGLGITREFYDLARRLTSERGSFLVVDSIQAALRAHGCLSIVDYPGFENCDPPDCETYSKALNAGQYPLSVLALGEKAADLYVPGVYGNTMTTNPRALEVGSVVLESLTQELKQNIRDRGAELNAKLKALAGEFPELVLSVSGTGLMVCAELDPARAEVVGPNGVEKRLREKGVAMIHGGRNGVRFTPHFEVNSAQIDLIVDTLREVLAEIESEPNERSAKAT